MMPTITCAHCLKNQPSLTSGQQAGGYVWRRKVLPTANARMRCAKQTPSIFREIIWSRLRFVRQKIVTTWHDDDHFTDVFYDKVGDDGWRKSGEIKYTRN